MRDGYFEKGGVFMPSLIAEKRHEFEAHHDVAKKDWSQKIWVKFCNHAFATTGFGRIEPLIARRMVSR
ncbi:hypothetical protein GO003_014890 [Methylicorpusculum oleiharenae]|uniref:hypothetical protein n=1 Tax=Methylicorpusculum oleiharenae TaxID=1338687 RepID=UPI001E4A72AB|nr:hypothetical protein [Methylicorpusculum oleiharenae]MCD2451678.1 hypothetical protein [Methylicorpusculum oleiharenae]